MGGNDCCNLVTSLMQIQFKKLDGTALFHYRDRFKRGGCNHQERRVHEFEEGVDLHRAQGLLQGTVVAGLPPPGHQLAVEEPESSGQLARLLNTAQHKQHKLAVRTTGPHVQGAGIRATHNLEINSLLLV